MKSSAPIKAERPIKIKEEQQQEKENSYENDFDSEDVDEMEERELNNKEKHTKKIKGILKFNSTLERLKKNVQANDDDKGGEFEPELLEEEDLEEDVSDEEYQELDGLDN